ncbi:hypothetical protein D6779_10900 [Candidatus Parcubacteria bacterium]|nr:MAG: hypothetical protein D6779_10900 [Candidatus Parcubacteria bacterium]
MEIVEIHSRDFWFKIVEFLQQNWALINVDESHKATIYFISDTSKVFDKITYSSKDEARNALRRNGFRRFAEDKEAQKFIDPPRPPYKIGNHPNGPRSSSGKFWLS